MNVTGLFLSKLREVVQQTWGEHAPAVLLGGSDGPPEAPFFVVHPLGTGRYEADRFSSGSDLAVASWSVVAVAVTAELAVAIDQVVQERLAPPVSTGRAVTLTDSGGLFTPFEVTDRAPLGRDLSVEPSYWTATTVYSTMIRFN